jgi:hypothetical protein
MEYEESIGCAMGKREKIIAYFHVLGLFMAKNMIERKKNPSVTHRCQCDTKFGSRLQSSF